MHDCTGEHDAEVDSVGGLPCGDFRHVFVLSFGTP